MLFVDRAPVTLTDLSAVDPSIPKVIDTEFKENPSWANDVIARAVSECINDLLAAVVSYESYPGSGDVGGNHLAAVYNVYGTQNVPRFQLSQVCMNPRIPNTWSPMKSWLTYYAAKSVYQSAWNTKSKDQKYATKAGDYKDEARRYWNQLCSLGVPLVWQPLIAPAAPYETDTGSWGDGNLTHASAVGTAGASCTVAVTWVDQKAYRDWKDNGNAESHPSEPATLNVPSGRKLVVDISTLIPPAGFNYRANGIASGVTFPRAASGWNVYVNGVLQNSTPIPVSTTTYTLAGDPAVLGNKLGTGQHPNVYQVMSTGIPLFRR